MDRTTDRKALKLQALAALDEARIELGTHAVRARENYAPRTLVMQGLAKHKVLAAVAAAAAGFVVMRFMFPRRSPIDKNSKPAKKRGLSGLLVNGLWMMARAPLLDFAKNHLQNYVMNRAGFTNTTHSDRTS